MPLRRRERLLRRRRRGGGGSRGALCRGGELRGAERIGGPRAPQAPPAAPWRVTAARVGRARGARRGVLVHRRLVPTLAPALSHHLPRGVCRRLGSTGLAVATIMRLGRRRRRLLHGRRVLLARLRGSQRVRPHTRLLARPADGELKGNLDAAAAAAAAVGRQRRGRSVVAVVVRGVVVRGAATTGLACGLLALLPLLRRALLFLGLGRDVDKGAALLLDTLLLLQQLLGGAVGALTRGTLRFVHERAALLLLLAHPQPQRARPTLAALGLA
mmetsp:Transcript_22028/g.70303  ORF Transcript_22028/g.70303 Transcript_22028/m.70303 type:complete len:272 (+) Transcript_22028:390-1205(+)